MGRGLTCQGGRSRKYVRVRRRNGGGRSQRRGRGLEWRFRDLHKWRSASSKSWYLQQVFLHHAASDKHPWHKFAVISLFPVHSPLLMSLVPDINLLLATKFHPSPAHVVARLSSALCDNGPPTWTSRETVLVCQCPLYLSCIAHIQNWEYTRVYLTSSCWPTSPSPSSQDFQDQEGCVTLFCRICLVVLGLSCSFGLSQTNPKHNSISKPIPNTNHSFHNAWDLPNLTITICLDHFSQTKEEKPDTNIMNI